MQPAVERVYCGHCWVGLEPGMRVCDQCGHRLYRAGVDYAVIRFGAPAVYQRAVPDSILGVFASFVLLQRLGEGGMGAVFLAMNPASGQRFALKIIRDDLRFRQRRVHDFVAEAQKQASIVHPNVVRFFELIESGGHPALVLEYVNGVSLTTFLSEQPATGLDLGLAIWLATQMCLGLRAVHALGYVHADVKPSNFLLGSTESGGHTLKIADFGITRELKAALTGGAHGSSGTPGYMSPEQIRGESLVPASDVYALGCVFYELLTGQPVFSFDLDVDSLLRHHLDSAPVPVDQRRAESPPTLSTLVMTMLDKRWDRRPANCDVVLAGLDQAALEHSGRAWTRDYR